MMGYQKWQNTNFYNNGFPKEGPHHCIYLLVILKDSLFKMNKNYSQVFLEECKYFGTV